MHSPLKSIKRSFMNEKGFTLIEMAIVVLLLGLAVAALSPLYKIQLKKAEIETTDLNISSISNSIGNFRSIYGRYPCPASLTMDRGNNDYGREMCPTAAGEAIAGTFIEASSRTFDFTDPFDGPQVAQAPRIRVGFVPFRHLGLDEEDAYDGYGNRIMYVVTEHMAFANTFQADGGGIEIVNEAGVTVLGDNAGAADARGTAHFMVFSYGSDNDGAFTQSGGRIPCVVGNLESENCDFDDGIYRLGERNSSGDGATNFDDKITFFTQSSLPLWQLSETTGDSGDIHHKVGGKLGIQAGDNDLDGDGNDDAVEEEAQITGTIRVQDDPVTAGAEGKVVAEQICDEDGNNCFEPKIFAGDLAANTGGLRCPDDDPDTTGEFMVGIRNNRPVCEDEVIVRCPSGQYMEGVNADGSIRCIGAPPPGCASETVEICGTDATLLASGDGDTFTVTGGTTGVRNETYECNAGTWEGPTSTSGTCTCNAATWTRDRNCWTGTTGEYTRTCTRICPENTTSCTSNARTECVCDPITQTRSYTCPDEYTGTGIVQERRRICPAVPAPGRYGYWSGWTEISNDCVCINKTETRDGECPTNYTGEVEEEWEFRCADESWHYVRDTLNTCSCEDITEIRDSACPDGQEGTAKETWKYTCATDTWEQVGTTDYSSCRTCGWQPVGTSSTGSVPIGKPKGQECSCSIGVTNACYTVAGGGFYNNYLTCQCQ